MFRVAAIVFAVGLAITGTVVRGRNSSTDALRHALTVGVLVLLWNRHWVGGLLFGICSVLGGLFAIGTASHSGHPLHWLMGVPALTLGLIALCVPAPKSSPESPG